MEKRVIEDAIICLIKEQLEIGISQKVELTSKLSSIGIDSIAMMSLLVFIEERFNFTVDEDVLISNRFITVNEIVNYVDEKTNKNN